MDPIQLTIIGVSISLTIILVIIGIQVSLILKEVRFSVQKTNKMLDDAGKVTETVSTGVTSMSGFINGIRTGLSVITALKPKGEKHE
jgi:hypothetical protein